MISPKVSVVIPTYNRKDILVETIQSVLDQSFNDFEILVIDNGSTDGTEHVIKEIKDNRIHYHWMNPTGRPAFPRNVGIRMAQGEYVAFLDSDDLWLPEKLEKQVAFLENNPNLNWVYCKFEQLEHTTGKISEPTNWQYYQGKVAPKLIFKNFIASPTLLINKSVFDKVGGFDERLNLSTVEDWELWLRIASLYPVGFVPEVLVRYRIHQNNLTSESDLISQCYSFVAAICSATSFNPEIYTPYFLNAVKSVAIYFGENLLIQGKNENARQILRNVFFQKSNFFAGFKLWLISYLNWNFFNQIRLIKKKSHLLKMIARKLF
jgi:glycosyltransferase involved in cell wall biosynthesis